MEKNAKIRMFFYKERKRLQRSECSFIKNRKENKDRNVLLKRMDAQPWGSGHLLTRCVIGIWSPSYQVCYGDLQGWAQCSFPFGRFRSFPFGMFRSFPFGKFRSFPFFERNLPFFSVLFFRVFVDV